MWQKFKQYINKNTFLWLYKISAPFRWQIFSLMLLKCSLTGVGVLMAVVSKHIVDLAGSSFGMTGSVVAAVCFTVLSLAGGMLLSIQSVRVTEQYGYHIRRHLYEHILSCEWICRVKYHSEGLLSRLTSDVNVICSGLVDVMTSLAATLLQLLMAVGLLWYYDWTLAVFAVITGPFAVVFSFGISRKLKRIQKNLQQTEAEYRVYMQERISHADVLKSFEKEAESLAGLDQLHNKRMYWVTMKNKWRALLATGISFVFSGSYLFAFISGSYKISAGVITFGTMTAFLSLVNQIQTPIYTLGSMLPQVVSVLASAERAAEITNLPAEVREEKNTAGQIQNIGICAKDLFFSYDQKRMVTAGVSLDIPPGQLAVMSGPSGVGKTTIVRLLLGFISPDKGQVYYYDRNGEKYCCSPATRKYISYVPQGNTLLNGTIADNLRIGCSDADEEKMQAALEMACAWEFVKELPLGLYTDLGEKGCGLSEGQAQRIAIARAFIRPAPVLILDEATSALDERTERAILNNLQSSRGGQTCLVVTHRHAAGEYADQMVELTSSMEKG